jgi:hypothetical protein
LRAVFEAGKLPGINRDAAASGIAAGGTGMSSLIGTEAPGVLERDRMERLGHSIRGKLQFMDFLVRAAIADVDRCLNEPDPGTRSFLRQLVEMHASSLMSEAEAMRLVSELTRLIGTVLEQPEGGLESAAAGDDGFAAVAQGLD